MRKRLPCLGVLGLALVLTTAAGTDQKEAAPKLYVTNSAGDNIHIIDLGSFKVIGEIRTGEHPHGAAVSADCRRLCTETTWSKGGSAANTLDNLHADRGTNGAMQHAI
jgi:YVTN family beta-propeller protein